MNKTKRNITTLLSIGLGIGIGALSAEGAGVSSGAYALMRRLFVKGGDAAADEMVRQILNTGALHEEYELTTSGFRYWDQFWGRLRGQEMPYQYRSMWLDPVTHTQHFETYNNLILEHRFPFYYVMHNRDFYCLSTGDPRNGYNYSIRAQASHLVMDRVIRAQPGHEVLHHPVAYTFGLTSLPRTCVSVSSPITFEEKGTLTIARNADSVVRAQAKNADVQYLIAIYAPQR